MTTQDIEIGSDDRLAAPRAPLRVMQILAELAKARGGMSLARLSEQLRLPKSSVFNLLRSLEEGDYVVSENGHHRLGQEAFNLAAAIYQHDGLSERLRPAMQWLQENTQETVLLAVPMADWTGLVFADVIESASSLRFTARIGAHRPLYSTSVGLALLAFAPADLQRQYMAGTELKQLTPATITNVTALQRILQRTRKDGYVINSGSVNGATAVAAPIFGPQGDVVASIGIAGPTSRFQENQEQFIAWVQEAGRRMSQMLGHSPPIRRTSPG